MLQDLFNMIHSVSKEMITVIQCVPRIAERTTPAIAAQLKVCCCCCYALAHYNTHSLMSPCAMQSSSPCCATDCAFTHLNLAYNADVQSNTTALKVVQLQRR